MKIFILIGLQLSGKSSHGHKLNKETKIPMIETGHAVYHELKNQKLEVNHTNTTKVIKSLLSKDPTAFTRAILKYEKEKYQDSEKLLLNGVKSPAEIEYARKNYGMENIFVLGFHASKRTRFSRVNNPDRFEVSGEFREKTQEDQDLAIQENFTSRDIREIGLGIGDAIALSNEILVTENLIWPYHTFDKSYKIFKDIIMKFD